MKQRSIPGLSALLAIVTLTMLSAPAHASFYGLSIFPLFGSVQDTLYGMYAEWENTVSLSPPDANWGTPVQCYVTNVTTGGNYQFDKPKNVSTGGTYTFGTFYNVPGEYQNYCVDVGQYWTGSGFGGWAGNTNTRTVFVNP